jgi:hypothetical protein
LIIDVSTVLDSLDSTISINDNAGPVTRSHWPRRCGRHGGSPRAECRDSGARLTAGSALR